VVDARTGALVYRNDTDLHTPVWTGRAGQLAAWDKDEQGHLVDARTGRHTRYLQGGFGGVDAAFMSAGGVRLLGWQIHTAGEAWEMWDLRTGDSINSVLDRGTSASPSPSGRFVVSSDGNQLWTVRVSNGHVLARHGGLVAGAVSPDGVVAASHADGSLVFLDLHTLHSDGRPLPDAPGIIEQFAFSRDSSLLAARSRDGTVRLVDMASRTQLGEPIAVTSAGDRTIAMRPDGRALAQPSPHGVLIWDLRPAHWQTAACHLAGRELTRDEWQTYLSAVGSYRTTCPDAA
jgi:WD40 repeat protein